MPEKDPTLGGKVWFCPSCNARNSARWAACILCDAPTPPDIAARAATLPPSRAAALVSSKRFAQVFEAILAVLGIPVLVYFGLYIREQRFGSHWDLTLYLTFVALTLAGYFVARRTFLRRSWDELPDTAPRVRGARDDRGTANDDGGLLEPSPITSETPHTREGAAVGESTTDRPALLRAGDLAESDMGSLEWNREHNSSVLTVSEDGLTVEWGGAQGQVRNGLLSARVGAGLDSSPPAQRQLPVGLRRRGDGACPDRRGIHAALGRRPRLGVLRLSRVQHIGVGLRSIHWRRGPRRGIDPGRAAYVPDGHTGIVGVELALPRHAEGSARFLIHGTESRPIQLPAGAVVLPAACLLREGQRVTIAAFARR